METAQHIFIVEDLTDDTPTFLSAHTDKAQADAAVKEYVNCYRYGGIEDDYRVRRVKLNPKVLTR